MENRIGPVPNRGALILSRSDVAGLLDLRECIAAVGDAFRLHAIGKAGQPGVLGIHVEDGSFHIKAAALTLERPYFAAKLNANFPHNGPRLGLPTIRGVLALCDASNGEPLAVMDSMSITALRTAAASAVAAKFLARERCDTALICGCGGQAPAQLRAATCMHSSVKSSLVPSAGARATMKSSFSIPRARRCRTSRRRPRSTGARSRSSRAAVFHLMHNFQRRTTCATN